jgi:hypothetical protein
MSTHIGQLELLDALEEIEACVVLLQECSFDNVTRVSRLCQGAVAATNVIREYLKQRMGKPS